MEHIGDEFKCAVLEGIILIMRHLIDLPGSKDTCKSKEAMLEYIEEVQRAIL